ncbi:MAG: VanZ family protein [Treponemataceae bacterium]|nr:VanZ family protein [Treponemataceae bacterium]
MKCLKTILRWLPALCIFGCSWYLSSQETIEQMPTFWNADKLVHCICYAGLAFWVAFAVGTKLPAPWRIALPIIIVSVWGITDEIHQSFTPGRESSVFDWCADTIGAVVGSLVFFYFCKGIARYKTRKDARR